MMSTPTLCRRGCKNIDFGTAGQVVIDFPGTETSGAYGLALTRASHIVVAAAVEINGQTQCALACLDSHGNLVPAFGTNGFVMAPLGDDFTAQPRAVNILANGKILLLAEHVDATGVAVPVIARLHPDGCIDTRFGNCGKTTVQVPGERAYDTPWGIQERANGTLILAIERASDDASTIEGIVVSLAEDGRLDTSFNGLGYAFVQVEGMDTVSVDGVIELRDGKLLAWGLAGEHGLFARLTAEGQLDATFGNKGVMLLDAETVEGGQQGLEIYHVEEQAEGMLMAFGSTNIQPYKAVMARITAKGAPDPLFNQGKPVVTDVTAKGARWLAGSVQADQGFATAGLTGIPYSGEDTQFLVGKYTHDGQLDTSFGENGLKTTNVDSGPDITRCFAFDCNGLILLAGTSDTPGPGSKTYVVSYFA